MVQYKSDKMNAIVKVQKIKKDFMSDLDELTGKTRENDYYIATVQSISNESIKHSEEGETPKKAIINAYIKFAESVAFDDFFHLPTSPMSDHEFYSDELIVRKLVS